VPGHRACGAALLPDDLLLLGLLSTCRGVLLGLRAGLDPVGTACLEELGLERADLGLESLLRLLREGARLADRREELTLRPSQVVEEVRLEAADVLHRDVVELPRRAEPDRDDLLLHREGSGLTLLEELDESGALRQLGARRRVQVGGEHRERLEGAVLREVELEAAGDRLHRLDLRGAADPGDRDTHVDGGTDVGVEQVGLEVDLAVRDRDDVRRDVRRDVTGLGLDDRQPRHRPRAEVIGELGTALEQPAVEVEDVARVRLASRRASQEERHGAVRLGLLGQVVEDDEDVHALVHPVLADGRAGVGGEVLEARGVGCRGGDDGRVLHRARLLEGAPHAGDGGALLTDGDVDAAHLLVRVAGVPELLLVDDRVDRDRRLAGLSVSDDELALATADRRHGVHGLEPRLQRLMDRLALDDGRSLELERAALVALDGTEAVDGDSEGVDDPAEEGVTDRHGEDLPGALDLLALLDARELAEDDDADLVHVQVEGKSQRAVLELEELVGHGRRQTFDVGDAVTGVGHAADLLAGGRAWVVGPDVAVQGVPDLLRTDRELRHVLIFSSVTGPRGPKSVVGW
jgi:hypothetical protein